MRLPLPPLDEQRRIARVLDQTERIRRRRREAALCYDGLPGAIFASLIGDPRPGHHAWPTGCVGDLAESVTYGSSRKAGSDGQMPILRMGNVTSAGRIDMTDLKYIDLPAGEVAKHTVRHGDVLFNRTNSADLVGKTAVYRGESPVAYAGYLMRVRVADNADPEYLGAFLNTSYAKQMLRGLCRSIVGMANINAKELRSIAIPLAPPSLQARFGGHVTEVEQRRGAYLASTRYLDALFASLQHRAFSGQL